MQNVDFQKSFVNLPVSISKSKHFISFCVNKSVFSEIFQLKSVNHLKC